MNPAELKDKWLLFELRGMESILFREYFREDEARNKLASIQERNPRTRFYLQKVTVYE
ncbi:MAG: hypothetical protein ACP5N7_05530 [Candidatus Pacearchaeota archaeon]